MVPSPPPLSLVRFSRSWCTRNWIWEESFNYISIAIYDFPVRKQTEYLGQTGRQVLCLRQAGFLCHVQIAPPAHLWYIWAEHTLSTHLGFLCISRGTVTPTECPMAWLESLQEFPGNHPKASQSTQTRTSLTQVPDTESHRSPENKPLKQDRKPFFGKGWTSLELVILTLASGGKNYHSRDIKILRTQMAKFTRLQCYFYWF